MNTDTPRTQSPSATTITTNEQVKDIILSYCQGIYHLEFDIEDLDEMVEKIIDNVTDQCG